MLFPGGFLYEEQNTLGVFSLLGSLMREGGVKSLSPAQFDKRLDDIGAVIESGFQGLHGSVSAFSHVDDMQEVFSYFSDVVMTPALNQKRFNILKSKKEQGIKRRGDSADTLVSMVFNSAVYGEGSPKGEFLTLSDLNTVGVSMLKKAHRKYVRPNGSRLVISGAVSFEEAKKLVKKNFSSWSRVSSDLPEIGRPNKKIEPGIYVLEKDFDQARAMVGHRGPPRHNSDHYNFVIYNELFGYGGFKSKLFSEVRSRLGLAYTCLLYTSPSPRDLSTYRMPSSA